MNCNLEVPQDRIENPSYLPELGSYLLTNAPDEKLWRRLFHFVIETNTLVISKLKQFFCPGDGKTGNVEFGGPRLINSQNAGGKKAPASRGSTNLLGLFGKVVLCKALPSKYRYLPRFINADAIRGNNLLISLAPRLFFGHYIRYIAYRATFSLASLV